MRECRYVSAEYSGSCLDASWCVVYRTVLENMYACTDGPLPGADLGHFASTNPSRARYLVSMRPLLV